MLEVKFESPLYVAVRLRDPAVAKVIEQFPAAEARVPVQVSPVLAVTVTVPVGTVVPVALNEIATDWPVVDGFGLFEVIVVELVAFWAATCCTTAGAALKSTLPACVAVSVQFPVPLVIFTVAPESEHAPLATIVTVRPDVDVAETEKVVL